MHFLIKKRGIGRYFFSLSPKERNATEKKCCDGEHCKIFARKRQKCTLTYVHQGMSCSFGIVSKKILYFLVLVHVITYIHHSFKQKLRSLKKAYICSQNKKQPGNQKTNLKTLKSKSVEISLKKGFNNCVLFSESELELYRIQQPNQLRSWGQEQRDNRITKNLSN